MAGLNGGVSVQGVAYRVTRLTADGICGVSATGIIQDDVSLVKLEAKPNMAQGVDLTPISAGGVPAVSFKDFDRYKRWDITFNTGDFDPEAMELISGQGAIVTAPSSSGRTFADGAVQIGEYYLDSPSLGAFVATDVGRSATGTGIPSTTTIVEIISATRVRLDKTATATGSGLSIVLGAIGANTVGYTYPRLLTVGGPLGVAIEIWSRMITRGTGYQGFVGYPDLGAPGIGGSGYTRTGIFRALLWPDTTTTENKEQGTQYMGWAIENPNFSTGPVDDWRIGMKPGGSGGGTPIPTVAWCAQVADFQLPTPLFAGYQPIT